MLKLRGSAQNTDINSKDLGIFFYQVGDFFQRIIEKQERPAISTYNFKGKLF
jgi:hypothetical protein